ncbi:MAG: PrsW family intramembrane metalloprotease [Gemmatimonadetes bacterium]|nr:PrsW family intramembrane metalloprotease [Gemmatimonadota bacterium]
MLMAVVAAVLPVAIYLSAVWLADRYEKEPLRLLGLALLGGAFVAPGLVFVVERLLGISSSIFPIVLSQLPLAPLNLAGAVVEEVVKGLLIILLAWRLPAEFDDTVDGVVYGAVVGAGFALTELAVYLWTLSQFGTVQVATSTVLGISVASLTQCVFSGLFGASIGFAREAGRGAARTWLPVLGFLAAVFYHMAYLSLGPLVGEFGGAVALLTTAADWTGILLLFFIVRWGWDRMRYVIRETLAEEASTGTVTGEEFQALVSGRWPRLQLARLQQLHAELAFAKWRAAQGRASGADADRYREEIKRLRERQAKGRNAS